MNRLDAVGRLGVVAVAVPIMTLAALGVVVNWPNDCDLACDELTGSTAWATIYAVAFAIAATGAILGLVGRKRLGLIALVATALVVVVSIFV